jgi:hypothetical protein
LPIGDLGLANADYGLSIVDCRLFDCRLFDCRFTTNLVRSSIRIRHSSMDTRQWPHRQSPIGSLESPIANRQSGIANRQSGIANRQSGIANRQSGIAIRQSGIAIRQSGIANRHSKSPIGNLQSVNRQSAVFSLQ